MGRLAALILSLFAITLGSMALAWLTIILASAVRRAYWRWKRDKP